MTNDARQNLIDSLTANPRQTAQELGIKIADAKALEAAGVIVAYGTRVTGKRGRPPIEWVVAGTEVTDEAAAAVERAQKRVDAHADYWRIANRMWQIREAVGTLAAREDDEYKALVERKAMIVEAHGGIPEQPTPNDLAITGNAATPVEDPADDRVLVAA